MKPFAFFFRFTREQRKGIVALFILILLVQGGYVIYNSIGHQSPEEKAAEEKEWLSLQAKIDELKASQGKEEYRIYPFNPNFISDYKGYTLGMSADEIDRLHKFRQSGKFVNSPAEFQEITGVHDSLLEKISPYFKFPDWVVKKQAAETRPYQKQFIQENKPLPNRAGKPAAVLDINDALEEDLVKVYGIGPAFAKMILRRRAQLGAFVSMDQMDDFHQLSPEAVQGLKRGFTVTGNPEVLKLNVNTASLNQLSYFPYFNKSVAKGILTQRSMKGRIASVEELLKINGFPVDKVAVITLYLEF